MPVLMSRTHKPDSTNAASSSSSSGGASTRPRSIASTRSTRSSHKEAELRARWEMAQAIQKPWPLHLLENGTKTNPAPQRSEKKRASFSPPPPAADETKKRSSISGSSTASFTNWIRKKPSPRESSPESASTSPSSSPKPL
ncbi:hypothetical protein PaG_03334 [Moesziomyces aphidis]|uniref:Uncharacterized protein n=1 Tax=Moesziomyces aphidis TaxID=84754 RepID=W3VNC6_MOEAP|nr:hypothetical protein PaG_03334 [Moesziomyces aphidis]